jgi:hypothetical protein
MSNAREFFEQIMNPFQFIGLLRFTFKGDQCTRQGAEFLNLLIYNCFVADPDEAKLECLEINFGFQVVVPGEEEESKEDPGNNESTAMKQEQLARDALLNGRERIFQKDEFDMLCAQQLSTIMPDFAAILDSSYCATKIQLYELLLTLLQLDNPIIIEAFEQ